MNRYLLLNPLASFHLFALVSFCVFLCFGDVTAGTCGAKATNIACGDFQGILYSIDNRLPPVQVSNLTKWQPLDVPDNSSLSISICNYGNFHVHDITIRNMSIVPSLVGLVGRATSVRVNVFNSANFNVMGSLIIGNPIYNMSQNQSTPGNDTSIVDKIVRGPVRDGASIMVNVSESANVRLRSGAKELWLARATMLNEIINGAHDSMFHCFMDACFEAFVSNSANVQADQVNGPTVIIQDGQLDDEAIDTGCLGARSYAHVKKLNVSNVRGVRNLTIFDGELSDETVDALHLLGARVDVQVANTANVDAQHVSINEGELIDEIVDARDVADSQISVLAFNSGNIRAQTVEIFEGELVDETVDVRHFNRSSLLITLNNIGNVHADGLVSIQHGELVDEALDAKGIVDGLVDISITNTSNVQCGSGAVNLNRSELLESVIDVKNVTNSNIKVLVSDSANADVAANSVNMLQSALAAITIDIDFLDPAPTNINVTTSESTRNGPTNINVTMIRSTGNGCGLCAGATHSCIVQPPDANTTMAH